MTNQSKPDKWPGADWQLLPLHSSPLFNRSPDTKSESWMWWSSEFSLGVLLPSSDDIVWEITPNRFSGDVAAATTAVHLAVLANATSIVQSVAQQVQELMEIQHVANHNLPIRFLGDVAAAMTGAMHLAVSCRRHFHCPIGCATSSRAHGIQHIANHHLLLRSQQNSSAKSCKSGDMDNTNVLGSTLALTAGPQAGHTLSTATDTSWRNTGEIVVRDQPWQNTHTTTSTTTTTTTSSTYRLRWLKMQIRDSPFLVTKWRRVLICQSCIGRAMTGTTVYKASKQLCFKLRLCNLRNDAMVEMATDKIGDKSIFSTSSSMRFAVSLIVTQGMFVAVGMPAATANIVRMAAICVVSFLRRSNNRHKSRCFCGTLLRLVCNDDKRDAHADSAHSLISWSTSCAANNGLTALYKHPATYAHSFCLVALSSTASSYPIKKKQGTCANARKASAITLYHCSLTTWQSSGRMAFPDIDWIVIVIGQHGMNKQQSIQWQCLAGCITRLQQRRGGSTTAILGQERLNVSSKDWLNLSRTTNTTGCLAQGGQ